MSDYFEKQRQEEQRKEELALQKKQLFAERVSAAAAVASAVNTAQAAESVERMRIEANIAAQSTARHQREVEIQQREMVLRQAQMAEEQRTTNFRQTVLATVPLLKEEERSQYLIEQLLPLVERKYENEKRDLHFRMILKIFKFFDFADNFFAGDPNVKKFMIEGINPKGKLVNATAEYNKTKQELEKTKSSQPWVLALVFAGTLGVWIYIWVKTFYKALNQ